VQVRAGARAGAVPPAEWEREQRRSRAGAEAGHEGQDAEDGPPKRPVTWPATGAPTRVGRAGAGGSSGPNAGAPGRRGDARGGPLPAVEGSLGARGRPRPARPAGASLRPRHGPRTDPGMARGAARGDPPEWPGQWPARPHEAAHHRPRPALGGPEKPTANHKHPWNGRNGECVIAVSEVGSTDDFGQQWNSGSL
jgi:hypothetical protein